MKKKILKTLVTIYIILFSFAIQPVNAQTSTLSMGSCVVKDSSGNIISNTQTTVDNCNAEGSVWTADDYTGTGSASSTSATTTVTSCDSLTSDSATGTCTFNQAVSYDQCYKWNTNGWQGSNRASGSDNKSGVCTTLGWSCKSCLKDNPGTTFTTTSSNIKQSAAPLDMTYTLLAPLPGMGNNNTFNPATTGALGNYLNIMLKLFIGICAVLAVIMMVLGGIEYMTSELPGMKEAGKSRITNAIFGLVLALLAWTLLYTINPNLLKSDLNIPNADLTVAGNNSIYVKPAADSVRCTPVTNSSSACTVSNLTNTFGQNATSMSKICNIESSGNAGNVSATDKGSDGTPFSFGLFQINLLANGSKIKGVNGESCSNLFVRSDGSPISGSNYIQKNSSGQYSYDAKLAPGKQDAYNACKAALLDPAQNIKVANQLPITAWKYSDSGVCPSAFN